MIILLCALSDYVNLSELIAKYDITVIKDLDSGVIKLISGANTLSISSDFNTAVFNKQVLQLSTPPKIIKGELTVSGELVSFIERNFKKKVVQKVNDQPKPKLKVLIDAGHGGSHRGTQGHNGTNEKDVNLGVALMLKKKLEEQNVQVVMTRESDVHLSEIVKEDLEQRVEVARTVKPDLFISIHANWNEKSSIRGFELFISRDGGYKDGSNRLAEFIRKNFNDLLATPDRGIKESGFYVLRNSPCPAVLVEMDFLSNRQAEMDLTNQAYREKIVNALSNSILQYIK